MVIAVDMAMVMSGKCIFVSEAFDIHDFIESCTSLGLQLVY